MSWGSGGSDSLCVLGVEGSEKKKWPTPLRIISGTALNTLQLNNPRYQHMTHATLGLSGATNKLGEQTYTVVSCNLSNEGKHKFKTLSVRSVSFRLSARVRDAL